MERFNEQRYDRMIKSLFDRMASDVQGDTLSVFKPDSIIISIIIKYIKGYTGVYDRVTRIFFFVKNLCLRSLSVHKLFILAA